MNTGRKARLQSRPSLLDSLAHGVMQRALQNIVQNSFQTDTGETITSQLYCIDATAGNGHDTCVLAGLIKDFSYKIHLAACDIQQEALDNTASRLNTEGGVAELFLCGHEDIFSCLPKNSQLACAVFNLGYLPGKDRKQDVIATKAKTSVSALDQFCAKLVPQGCISVHCYTGHTGGNDEYLAVRDFAALLDPKKWRVLCVSDVNREHNLEYLFLLERLQEKKRG